jgi:hypothetical protein
VRDGSDRQNIGIEVDDLGELSEPERVKFGEGGSEIRSSCKRGSESTWSERFDINWVGLEGGSSIGPRFSNVLMGCRTRIGDRGS